MISPPEMSLDVVSTAEYGEGPPPALLIKITHKYNKNELGNYIIIINIWFLKFLDNNFKHIPK